MITGFNVDVRYKSVTYHVQTEDKGPANPLVLTLVYKGGEILDSRRLIYKDLPEGQTETGIAKLMEDQHNAMVSEIKRGKFDKDAGTAATVMEDLSLDELVLAYLAARAATGH